MGPRSPRLHRGRRKVSRVELNSSQGPMACPRQGPQIEGKVASLLICHRCGAQWGQAQAASRNMDAEMAWLTPRPAEGSAVGLLTLTP